MDDLVGYREVLVATAAMARDASALAGDLFVLVAQPGGRIAGWLERLGVHAALVRSDRYLAGTALDRKDLEALLAGYAARCYRALGDAARGMIAAT
jgi:3-(3-hydroxy-phenyl)propionate hydroxylase